MNLDPSSRGAAADQSGAAAAAWRQLTGSRDRAARIISEDLWREPAQLQMVNREMTLFRYLALLVCSRYIVERNEKINCDWLSEYDNCI